MCGIFFNAVKGTKRELSRNMKDVLPYLLNRGPEKCCKYDVKFFDWNLHFCGCVLWMQGRKPVLQPAKDTKGNILLWNGDIFDGPWISGDITSDTKIVLEEIFGFNSTKEQILESLAAIKGPYSFVYWCESTKQLWFGRDCVGRHSLLIYSEIDTQFTLSSVGKRGISFSEVPVVGIFIIQFSEDTFSLTIHPWSNVSEDFLLAQDMQIPYEVSKLMVASPICMKCPLPYNPSEEYRKILIGAWDKTPFFFDKLLAIENISNRVEHLLQSLRKAVGIRCKTHPGMCKICLKTSNSSFDLKCCHPKVGVLFSGGIDSTVIAALAHENVPLEIPIDLVNVAFENCNKPPEGTALEFNTPDRITGIQSSEELRNLFPNRHWNFIQIDVSKEELNNLRTLRIGDLIHPLTSVLDDSLGCALWFASRLCGTVNDVKYQSPARVLLLGMGADELFGGYTRHRRTLRHQGWTALAEEIDIELQRIATRNLGRDDRIVADHGHQARFPFLDEDVINFVSSLPLWARCYPTCELPPGFGDKLLLRLVAWKLGLKTAAAIPKRAFQFGSRIANKKEKASDVSSRLK